MPPPPPPPPPHHHRDHHLAPLVASALALTVVFLVAATAVVMIYRKLTRKKALLLPATESSSSPTKQPLQRLSHALIRRATGGLSAANRIGQGGFGSVYRGVLPSGLEVAVKLMNDASAQGEREFHNEISLVCGADVASCPYVVSLLGFSAWDCDKGWWSLRRLCGGSATDGKKLVLVYEYMRHGSLQEALLDGKCNELNCWKKRFHVIMCVAKGLEFLHSRCDPPIVHGDIKPSNVLLDSNLNAKIADFGLAQRLGKGGDDDRIGILFSEEGGEKVGEDYNHVGLSPEKSQSEVLPRDSRLLELGVFSRASLDGAGEKRSNKPYLNRDWIANVGPIETSKTTTTKNKKKLEWWASFDRKDRRDKPPREWWKEEFCDELSKKTKGKPGPGPEGKRKPGRTSADRWLDSFGGGGGGGGGGSISSTPSMRGTICYIAPECGGRAAGAQPPSEKWDVYSFGVLLLVVISGRRPLQVAASPLSEFERANLISWARQLAVGGRLLDLVDPNVRSLDGERALLCVTVALLCLQRLPGKRPSMKEVVEMLSGRCEPPSLPLEFSPSPPCSFPFKSRRKSK